MFSKKAQEKKKRVIKKFKKQIDTKRQGDPH